MSVRYRPTLMAFAEEIEQRGLGEWLIAHTSFLKPLHRWEGTLELADRSLRFEGCARRGGEPIKLSIETADISDVHYGFDDCFRRGEDRQMGLLGFMPLRIRYRKSGHRERTLYLFAGFSRTLLGRRCRNEELAAVLEEARANRAA